MPASRPRTTVAPRRLPPPPPRSPVAPARQSDPPIVVRGHRTDESEIVDAFLACANGLPPGALVEQREADGLRMIQRRGMIGLLSENGVKTQTEEGGDKTLGPLPIAHIKDGVIYRDYSNYVREDILPRAMLHVSLFEDAFAAMQASTRE